MEIKDTSSSARVEKSAAQLPSPPPSTGEQVRTEFPMQFPRLDV